MSSVFDGMGVEIAPLGQEDFLKVKETLTRMGQLMPPKTLYQTCYLLHKRGCYAIMHHKEMERLDGAPEEMTDNDVACRNTIANLLDQWGLAEVMYPEAIERPRTRVTVIPHRDKDNYDLVPTYHIGVPH